MNATEHRTHTLNPFSYGSPLNTFRNVLFCTSVLSLFHLGQRGLSARGLGIYKTTGHNNLWQQKETKQMHESFTELIKWSLENENTIYSLFILL